MTMVKLVESYVSVKWDERSRPLVWP
jgi:hypothetical protein